MGWIQGEMAIILGSLIGGFLSGIGFLYSIRNEHDKRGVLLGLIIVSLVGALLGGCLVYQLSDYQKVDMFGAPLPFALFL